LASNFHQIKHMSERSVRRYMFGDFVLEPSEGRLSRISLTPVDLTGKPFEVLVFLVENQGRLVTRDELLSKVWSDTNVSDQSLTEVVSRVRKVLDPNEPEKYIETVRGKGYRFVVPISEVIEDPIGELPRSREGASPEPVQPVRRRVRFGIGMTLVLLIASISLGFVWIRLRPNQTPPDPLKRAVQAEVSGDDDLALKILGQVAESDPDFVEARLKGAWLLYQADQNDKAKQFFAPLSGPKLPNSLPKATRSKVDGMSNLLEDQDVDALNDFQAASGADPKDLETLVWIANIATSIGNPEVTEGALDKCTQLDRWNPQCGYERIDALAHENRFDDAIGEFNLLRQHSPYPWLDVPAGYAELAKGGVSAALEHFKMLYEHAPKGSSVHLAAAQDGMAQVDLVQGKLASAHTELEGARDSTDSLYERADYSIQLATIDALQGNIESARKELADAIAKLNSPEKEKKEIGAARVYSMIGAHAEALDHLSKLQQEGVNYGERYTAANSFVKGMKSLSEHDFVTATSQLATSMRYYENPETAFFQGKAAMAANDWDTATSSFEWITKNKALVFEDSIGSLIPLAEYNLSVCHKQSGNGSESNKLLTRDQAMWSALDAEIWKQLVGKAKN
jgi:DNA-binding winged helix-turn-helix (wHTH) protein/tetratricopeptide (TPR) repeat protein